MGYYSLLVLLCTNLLTAMMVTICHYIANSPSLSDAKVLRHIRVPVPPPALEHYQPLNHSILSYFNHSLTPSQIKRLDATSPIRIVHTNCSLPQRRDDCSFVQFEALLNIADRTVCRCENSRISIGNKCVSELDSQRMGMPSANAGKQSDTVSIFAVTPTYARYTQKADLTNLCYTIQHVPNILWIVIEDSVKKTVLVSDLLERCKVKSIHLNVKTSSVYKVLKSRGVEQRNTGLGWIREHCKPPDTKPECQKGVLYFMDDDNKYDLRLFEEIKKTLVVSVLPVAFSGGLKFEGPICEDGVAVKWRAHYAPERIFPMDMAGFAINILSFLSKPGIKMGFFEEGGRRKPVRDGHLETGFLENFASRETVECRGSSKEVFVWHVKTLKPPLPYEAKHRSDPKLEV